jgi:hypothetical protein
MCALPFFLREKSNFHYEFHNQVAMIPGPQKSEDLAGVRISQQLP